jgi:hypothetical protein
MRSGGLPSGRGGWRCSHSDGCAATGNFALRQKLERRPARAEGSTDEEAIIEVIRQSGWLWDSKATATRAKLASVGAKPKLWANFVTDDNDTREDGQRATSSRGDVLEIGPGTGNPDQAHSRG